MQPLDRETIRLLARSYARNEVYLADMAPPGLIRRAIANEADPRLTWDLLRHLCRQIRFNSRNPIFGSATRLNRARALAAGEVAILRRQREAVADLRHARQSQGFLTEMLS